MLCFSDTFADVRRFAHNRFAQMLVAFDRRSQTSAGFHWCTKMYRSRILNLSVRFSSFDSTMAEVSFGSHEIRCCRWILDLAVDLVIFLVMFADLHRTSVHRHSSLFVDVHRFSQIFTVFIDFIGFIYFHRFSQIFTDVPRFSHVFTDFHRFL